MTQITLMDLLIVNEHLLSSPWFFLAELNVDSMFVFTTIAYSGSSAHPTLNDKPRVRKRRYETVVDTRPQPTVLANPAEVS